MGKKRSEAKVHDPDELRERLEGDEAKSEERDDVRAKADQFGITNADDYTDGGLAQLVRIREKTHNEEKARQERIEAFKESVGDSFTKPDEVESSFPGAADVEQEYGDQEAEAEESEAPESEGGEG